MSSISQRQLLAHQQRARSGVLLKRWGFRLAVYLLLILICLAVAFPFYFMAVAAFMRPREILTLHPRLLPERWQLDGFVLLFDQVPFLRNMLNSFFVSTLQTLGIVFLSSLAGYAFAKSDFPGRQGLFAFVLITMMLPSHLQLIPMYQLMSTLHWRNTYLSLIAPELVTAFGIFMARQYIAQSLPDELVDAAAIDGSSFFGTYWRICLPVIVPGLTVLALFTFVSTWNNFLWPLLMLDQPTMFTVPIALVTMQGGAYYDPIFLTGLIAGALLGTIPLLILFLLSQRLFVSGIMSGAFKGGVV
jgi:cellobiose transport system permease protein